MTALALTPSRLAYIGLGGNLNAPDQTIRQAIETLRQTPGIESLKVSSLWRTLPVDSSGPDYCNAVAEVSTALDAHALLDLLLALERAHGRIRTVRNAPRTLDLDLIAIKDEVCTDDTLTLPHPRAHQRAFVLLPLCELNPSLALGAMPPFQPAAHWKALLSPEALGEARPW